MVGIRLEEKYILEYIKDVLHQSQRGKKYVNDNAFHHNTDYSLAPSVCKNGILSIQDIHNLGLRKFSKEQLKSLADIESHANGIDCVSLSKVGLTDLYRDEMEYDPFDPVLVDFLVSSDIKTSRYSQNYGNEFLSKSIRIDKIRSADIRLLKLIKEMEESKGFRNCSIPELISKYNSLRDMALVIKESQLDIPIREMSEVNMGLDVDKLSKIPQLTLKKQL